MKGSLLHCVNHASVIALAVLHSSPLLQIVDVDGVRLRL
jgi:hypothetical protein